MDKLELLETTLFRYTPSDRVAAILGDLVRNRADQRPPLVLALLHARPLLPSLERPRRLTRSLRHRRQCNRLNDDS